MTDALPSAVLTQVQAILAKDAEADRIALFWPEPLPAGEWREQVSGRSLRLVYCPSELAMRERLISHRPGAEPLVMLTPFDETRLSKDVLARLWSCEPKRISPWHTLEQLLQTRQIDPRLTTKSYRWIAEALVDGFDRYRGRISFGEVLDLETAWRALALAWLDFSAETPDLDALLAWSLDADAAASVAALPASVAEHLEDWLGPALGGVGSEQTSLVLGLWRAGHAGDMVAIGLVCAALYHPGLKLETKSEPNPDQALFQARGRLRERLLGDVSITDTALQGYGRATVAAITRHATTSTHRALDAAFDQAEQMLASLDMLALAEASDLLPAAFGQRLDRLALRLTEALAGKAIAPALDTLADLRRHRLAKVRGEQLATAALAVRACRWLRTPEPVPASMNDAVRDYVTNGGFLDWARSRLWSGDAHEGLSRVYAKLVSQVSARRERFNARFADFLPAIARGDQSGPKAGLQAVPWLQPIERAMETLVAPLARQQPVLVLVLDGMSQAVYLELTQNLWRQGWVELQPDACHGDQLDAQTKAPLSGGSGPCCLLAALPSLTRVSRFALLSGTIGEGGSHDEKKAFAAHAAFKPLSAKYPPVLLHKADLQQHGSGALADGVRELIAGPERKVVGAVINAVDDHLSSGAQVAMRWSVDSIGVLGQLLDAARESGRLVILTSDHGHVLDHDMTLVKSEGEAERCKPVTEPVGEGERRVSGARVVAPDHAPNHDIVLPWSERIRYAAKKMGYHGGGSPQEVLVPFGVYRSAGDLGELEGWQEVARQTPDWWNLAADAQFATNAHPETVGWVERSVQNTPAESPSPPAKLLQPAKSHKRDERTLDLFAHLSEPEPTTQDNEDWIEKVLRSPVYAQMKARGGRVRVSEAQLRTLLEELEAAGGQQMTAALAQRLGIPELRLNGFLAGVQKLLNVDGYPVLSVDRASKTVRLDLRSLKTQFEV